MLSQQNLILEYLFLPETSSTKDQLIKFISKSVCSLNLPSQAFDQIIKEIRKSGMLYLEFFNSLSDQLALDDLNHMSAYSKSKIAKMKKFLELKVLEQSTF